MPQTDSLMEYSEESRTHFQGVTNPQEIFEFFLDDIEIQRIIDRFKEKMNTISQNKGSHNIMYREITDIAKCGFVLMVVIFFLVKRLEEY